MTTFVQDVLIEDERVDALASYHPSIAGAACQTISIPARWRRDPRETSARSWRDPESRELAFHAEKSGGNLEARAARQHVVTQKRCMERLAAVQQPLNRGARGADLVAASLARERPDRGGLKSLCVATARESGRPHSVPARRQSASITGALATSTRHFVVASATSERGFAAPAPRARR